MRLSVFQEADLMPPTWLNQATGASSLLNPAITAFQGETLMCYRVVTADGRRRLAFCRLTPDDQVAPGSVTPFSDSVQGGGDWHAEPASALCRRGLWLCCRAPIYPLLAAPDADTLAAIAAAAPAPPIRSTG